MNGTSIAAALAQNHTYSRISVSGQSRAPFCGMGVCQECRVKVDGLITLSCQTLCQDGMNVETYE